MRKPASLKNSTSQGDSVECSKLHIQQLIHDLATPLSSLNGFVSQIYNEKGLKDPKALKNIKTTLEQLNRIVNSSQDLYARKSSKKVFSLDVLIGKAVASLQHNFESEKVKVESALSPTLVYGNEVHLERALTNILRNSLESFRLNQEGRCIWIELKEEDQHIRIIVKDNGRGVNPEDLPLIFDRGFTTKAGDNLGLGLFYAREVIRDFGGEIKLSSGEFTRVEIAIPRVARN